MSCYHAYEDKMDSGLMRVVLTTKNSMVQITPGMGFNLYSWIVDGRELMMPTQNIGVGGAGYGNPILFPTPNRIRDCTYTFEGKTHVLQKFGKERFIHGLVLDEPFSYRFWTDASGAYCEGTTEIRPGEDMYSGYPFACLFTTKISFCEKGILMDFTVENKGNTNMPFGLAIHPYFTKTGDQSSVFLSCPATHRYEADETLLPNGKLIPVANDAQYDLTQLRPLSQTNVDTVYSGMDSTKSSRIEFRDWGKAITFSADDAFGKVVVYTPPNRPGFCIEPQTCSTDFINLYAKGLVEESGMIILPKEQTWQGQIRMDLETL